MDTFRVTLNLTMVIHNEFIMDITSHIIPFVCLVVFVTKRTRYFGSSAQHFFPAHNFFFKGSHAQKFFDKINYKLISIKKLFYLKTKSKDIIKY